MKKIGILLFLAVLMCSDLQASLERRNFGIGAVIGEPTGVSFKNWLSRDGAIDGALAWSFSDSRSFTFYLNFLRHSFDKDSFIIRGTFPYYYGAGTRLVLREKQESSLGIRGVIGLDYIMDFEPIELFIELGPVLDVIPDTAFDFGGGVGVRYYFE